jgi:hypothetical protein
VALIKRHHFSLKKVFDLNENRLRNLKTFLFWENVEKVTKDENMENQLMTSCQNGSKIIKLSSVTGFTKIS